MDQQIGARAPWSVKRYLTLTSVIAVLALVAGCWYGFAFSAGRARADALTELKFQSDRAAVAVAESVTTGEDTVRALAGQPGLEAVFATRDNGCSLTAGGAGAFRSVRLDIVSAQGTTGCSSGTATRVFASHVHRGSDWLGQAMDATGTTVVWDARDEVTGRSAVVVTAPVVAGDRPVGAIALFLHVPKVASALAHDFAGSERAAFTVVDVESRRLLSSSQSGASVAAQRLEREPRSSGQREAADGAQRLFSSAEVPGSTWRVYAGLPS
ncbi:MAG: hypothetical protein ACRDUA_19170, partial [Micromonosporaceae bacterium]